MSWALLCYLWSKSFARVVPLNVPPSATGPSRSNRRRQIDSFNSLMVDVSVSALPFSLSGEISLSGPVAANPTTSTFHALSTSNSGLTPSANLPGSTTAVISDSTTSSGTNQSGTTVSTSISSVFDSSLSTLPLPPFTSTSISPSEPSSTASETISTSFSYTSSSSLPPDPGLSSISSTWATSSCSTSLGGSFSPSLPPESSSSGRMTSIRSSTPTEHSSASSSSSPSVFSSSTPSSLPSVSSGPVSSLSTVLLSTKGVSSSKSSVSTSWSTSSGFIFSSSTLTSSSHRIIPSSSIPSETASTVLSSATRAFSQSKTTIFTTTFITTTLLEGHTTVSGTIGTGTLSTDTPRSSSFSRNRGAVIGVAIAAIVFLIAILFLIFFGCKRYKARASEHGSIENILAIARETSWRAPVDGGDSDSDSEFRGHSRMRSLHNHGVRSPGGRYSEDDHFHRDGGRHSSIEGTSAGLATPMNPNFGGEPYMPGPSHRVEAAQSTTEDQEGIWWASNDPIGFQNPAGPVPVSSTNGRFPDSRSNVSLTVVGGSSSSGHGWSSASSGDHHSKTLRKKRNSLSEPRLMPQPKQQKERRHKSTPPSAFPTHDLTPDLERQHDQMDKKSVRSFFDLLRARKVSNKSSTSTMKGFQPTLHVRGSDETTAISEQPVLFSPSLLNPPILISPSQSPHFPQAITGQSYAEMPSRIQPEMSSRGRLMNGSATIWTPTALPAPPSPDLTENSSMVEGLLHPRLQRRKDAHEQDSLTSLLDHEDYSRPISGIVHNHIMSTTTLNTHFSIASEDDGQANTT